MGDVLDPWLQYLAERQKKDYGPDWDIPPWCIPGSVPRETEKDKESQ